MIIKPSKEKGYDAQEWYPTGLQVNPATGDIGATFGLFKDRSEWQKSMTNNLVEQGIPQVTVTPKIFNDMLIAVEEATVSDENSPFFGCPIEP